MMKHVMIAGLCLCIASSCTPKKPEVTLVATSKEEYEKSLILMATGLSAKDRLILSKAIAIIQKDTPGLDQVDDDTNKRVKVSGKTRTELISEARSVVLDWYRRISDWARLVNKYRSLTNDRISVVMEKDSRYGDVVGSVVNKSNIPVRLDSVVYPDVSTLYASQTQIAQPNGIGKFTVSNSSRDVKWLRSQTPLRIHLNTFEPSGKEVNFWVSPSKHADDKMDTWARPEYIEFLDLIGVKRPDLG